MESAERAIAIVGVGAIMPQALSAGAYWQNILNRKYCVSEVPPERWRPEDFYDPDPKAPDKTYSKIGGWVRDFEFDWRRFRIPPKVAEAIDEGQQWALTIAADALDDYGYPERPLNTERTAVIFGTAMGGERHYETTQRIVFPEFARALKHSPAFHKLPPNIREAIIEEWHQRITEIYPPITEDTMPGELPNIVSGRVANVLNLRGPNYITDAACASSFAAIEAAVEMLTKHKVDAVVTGGMDRNMGASTFVKFCKIGALSATGSRPFAEGADGFVMGEGAAAFVLKRLTDAEASGDKIYAVIRGVGGASDGKGKGITAPNPIGQELAMKRAWESAGLDPATVTLMEAHGTSTRVGDVVEVESLNKVFGNAPARSIALGSAKSNIGHLKAGAGAAGLLKAAFALHHQTLPPTLNATRPNPNIDFTDSPFYLNRQARQWEKRNGTPRRCGVSAYGFGGTNFHLVLEEHVPGMLAQGRHATAAASQNGGQSAEAGNGRTDAVSRTTVSETAPRPAPVRGILALGAETPRQLKVELDAAVARVEGGWMPPRQAPESVVLSAPERLIIDFDDRDELLQRLDRAQKVMGFDTLQAWEAVSSQGVFRGHGQPPGKIAFLFPGQGSQYVNMGRELADVSPLVAETFAEADAIMAPILGKPLTDYIFVDGDDQTAVNQAQLSLMQTAITQPAVLTLDIAILRLLDAYGFRPDVVMGHSLGEYAALVAAGVMPFAHALQAAAARGEEMSNVSVGDNGKMAAILASYETVVETLQEIDGYVVPANINSHSQSVIGGASDAVDKAVKRFQEMEIRAIPLPVSHAFHTKIVAPASAPLRQVLDRMDISTPELPLVANVTGDFYPTEVEAIKDVLEKQIASPVQWVKGLETLYEDGVRAFIEVGPKRALRGFVRDVLAEKDDVLPLMTNHPKIGGLPAFNRALCALYAAGYQPETAEKAKTAQSAGTAVPPAETAATPYPEEQTMRETTTPAPDTVVGNGAASETIHALNQLLSQALQQNSAPASQPVAGPNNASAAYDRNRAPAGSVVISGTGLGLPGAEKSVMDPDNAMRILRGEQFVDLIPERFRKKILDKQITRLVKSADGSGSFETITDPDDVIKLAGRPGDFDLHEEYGVPQKLIAALDSTTQLAMAAGLDALREAGIPLVQTYRRTTTGKHLPDRWRLPDALQDETGVIFASAFPGGDRFAGEMERYFTFKNRRDQLRALRDLRRYTQDPGTLRELDRRIDELRRKLEEEPYHFDRRFLFRILAMGHSQFAEYIGARGPNTHVNAACASTAQGVALAEDWIRNGRCRRAIVIGADNATGDNLMEWVGAGFLAVGAAATDDRVEEAALPFDKRRHGTLMGMGACALVVESEDAMRERGMRGIVELLSAETNNSAFHGTRLDVNHIAQVMDNLVTAAERRFGLNRYAMAPEMVFMSHETYTPARGGSAAAEVTALRHTFGEAAREIVVANTKGFTGHPMGVGVEDVIAVKILEHGIVPPVPNFKEVDEDLGPLNLSRGGRYPVRYALHLAAGFGSQISFTLTRRIPGAPERVDSRPRYQRWLDNVSGYNHAETEVEKRVLRIKAEGPPPRSPAPSNWQYGAGPRMRVQIGDGETAVSHPAPMPFHDAAPAPEPAPAPPKAEPTPPPETKPAPPPRAKEAAPAAPALVPDPVPTPAPEPAPATVAPEPAETEGEETADSVQRTVLDLVAEQTGYPPEMLDLDLDLEADLGIDTVKQAETFAAIRETFDIPRRDDLSLRDYNTLEKVVGFVYEMRPELESKSTPESVPTPPATPVTAAPPDVEPEATDAADEVTEKVLDIVAEQTGYPPEMLEMDLDLEADLGIDTVKQAETFAAIRETFDIPRRDDLSLRDYNTLEKVVGFVYEMRPELASREMSEPVEEEPEVIPSPTLAERSHPVTLSPDQDEVTEKVLGIVAEQTGYPPEMLEMDLDLEADLGIDTVKQAETFASIRETFDIPRRDELSLRDYNTLEKVVGFVYDMRPDLKGTGVTAEATEPSAVAAQPSAPTPGTAVPAHKPQPYPLENADQMPRRVPVPILRPELDLCRATGPNLDENSRVLLMGDQGRLSRSLLTRLEKRGVTVLEIEEAPATEALTAQLEEWLDEGPIHGVYWLPALDDAPPLAEMDLATWREENRIRTHNLYTTMRRLYDVIDGPDTFLIVATRFGGLHGYGRAGASAPLGGGVSGFAKAYKRERPDALVKVVDFPQTRKTAVPAERLIAETLFDPGAVEIGYPAEEGGERYTISLVEQPPAWHKPGLILNRETVFLVTGAAGGITSAIVADLAAGHSAAASDDLVDLAETGCGTFYLLDLAPAPERDDEKITLFRSDKDALKQHLIAEAKEAGERPTPVMIDKQVMAIERRAAALAAIEAVEAVGGTARYYSVDLRDGEAVTAVVDQIREAHGKIDALIHAAGLEISRALNDKDPDQFDLVYGVKADGFFNLLHAAAEMPIAATVVFSSVAGRFGNSGQTDYSAANDLLCKLSSSLRRWRPETRGIAIDWTAWAGIGMATRGSIPKIMEMAGIEMLLPEAGIPTVRRELLAGRNDGNGAGEIVVGGELGALVKEWDDTGGLDVAKANERLAVETPLRLMVGEITGVGQYSGLVVETTLDPEEQPFLYDHAMDGTPLLPGVMGTEAFAQLATALAPGYRVAAIENERFLAPFKFYRMEPQTLHLRLKTQPDRKDSLLAGAELWSIRELAKPDLPSQEKLHFTADVRLTPDPLPQPVFEPPQTDWKSGHTFEAEQIYDVYFHGPAYQVLQKVKVEKGMAVGLMAADLPPNTDPADAASLFAPRLLELCFQTAGVWEIAQKGRMALPHGIRFVTVYRSPDAAAGKRLTATVKAQENGALFDAQVMDEEGNLYVMMTGYQTVALPGEVSL